MTAVFTRSAELSQIKDRLDHPVIDADGHHIECVPIVVDIAREIAGSAVADRLDRHAKGTFERAHLSPPGGFPRVRVFWGIPAENTLDRMTATLPRLLYERLDQFGIDFALLYPSLGIVVAANPDDELRQVGTRALNIYYSQMYRDYRDRLEPVAIIPTFTPEEAVAELDYAVGTLGLKAVVMSAAIPRSTRPDGTELNWVDTLGHGSLYDYTPVWAKCVELGVAPAFHGSAKGWGSRVSSTNFVYNHLGHFAAAQEAACRSLVMSGVPRRFPELRFSFLEGGVSWSCQLLADLLGHYDKRNLRAVMTFDPGRLNLELVRELIDQYADGRMADAGDRFFDELRVSANATPPDPATLDDFAESRITGPDDIIDMFTRQFHFGCEADDPLNALAFNRSMLPPGARLNAMFASDIGHWDVPDMREVVIEAWELVEHGNLDEDDFRDFMCGNVVRMLTAGNPAFFAGTAAENAVRPFAAAPSAP